MLLINGNDAEPEFSPSHNNSFRICDDETSDEQVPPRDREGTPFIRLWKMWLVLTTTRKPFDPLLGWIFGSDDEINYREVQEAVPQVRRLRFHGSLIETPLVARGEHTCSQYTLQEEIGKRTYGTVFKVFDPSTNRVYAAKKILYEYSPAEIDILRRVSHVSLSKLSHWCVANDRILELHCSLCRHPRWVKYNTRVGRYGPRKLIAAHIAN